MKKTAIFLLLLLLCLSCAISVSANSAEPPGLIVIATGLPEDAELSLTTIWSQQTPDVEIRRSEKLWETYFRFFFHGDMTPEDLETAVLEVTTSEGVTLYPLPQGDYQHYSTVLTLDHTDNVLVFGQLPWRQPVMTAIRITLTLLCEGLIFFLFGFRKWQSWLVFAAVNLLTQGWLNFTVNGYAFSNGYWVLALWAMEAAIFLGEAILIPLAVRERKPWQRIVYALTANAVSLFVGIQLISRLPL